MNNSPFPRLPPEVYEEKLPFLSILPFPWIPLPPAPQAAGVQVSCRRSVSWRWRELRKNAINEKRGRRHLSRNLQWKGRGGGRGDTAEDRESRDPERSRNLRLWQWRHSYRVHVASGSLYPALSIPLPLSYPSLVFPSFFFFFNPIIFQGNSKIIYRIECIRLGWDDS